MAAATKTQIAENEWEAANRFAKANRFLAEIPTFISAETLKIMTKDQWDQFAIEIGEKRPPSAATVAMIIAMAEARDKAQAKYSQDPFAGFPGADSPVGANR